MISTWSAEIDCQIFIGTFSDAFCFDENDSNHSNLKLAHRNSENCFIVTLDICVLINDTEQSVILGLIAFHSSLSSADLLTSAVILGSLTVLDIGVSSSDAIRAEDDCCDHMFQRKRNDYRQLLHEMEIEQRVLYRSLIWSTWDSYFYSITFQIMPSSHHSQNSWMQVSSHWFLILVFQLSVGMIIIWSAEIDNQIYITHCLLLFVRREWLKTFRLEDCSSSFWELFHCHSWHLFLINDAEQSFRLKVVNDIVTS